MRVVSVVLVLVLVAVGCGEPEGGARAGVTERDSAGVSIIEHSSGAVDATPAVALGEPTFAIGGPSVDANHDATFFTRGWLRDDGAVALVGRESRFLRFDGSGTLLARFGGSGTGPNEFQAMLPLDLGGDSLLLADVMRSTTLVLRNDITPGLAGRFGDAPMFEYGVFGTVNGTLFAVHRNMRPGTERSGPATREALVIVRRVRGGATWDTAFTVAGELAYPMMMSEGGVEFPTRRPVTFGPVPMQAVWQGQVINIDNGDWTVAIHDSAGTLTRSIRIAQPLRPVTQTIRDSVVAREEQQVMTSQIPPQFREQFLSLVRSQQFAEQVAPYDRVRVTRDGALYLRLNVTPVDTTTTWYRFDGTGRLIHRLTLPRDWMLFDVDDDRALIRRTDDDGLGYLEIRPIQE